MSYQPPPTAHSLSAARMEITTACQAAQEGDHYRQTQYARAAIDSAAEAILNPDATQREVVAARFYLREGLGLDGRANDCGSDSIDTEQEARGLSDEDRAWLQNYLNHRRPAQQHTRADNILSL